MKKSSPITASKVRSAANQLQSSNLPISCRSILAITGGSMTTINKTLRSLRASGEIPKRIIAVNKDISIHDWITTVTQLLVSAHISVPPLPSSHHDEWFVLVGIDEITNDSAISAHNLESGYPATHPTQRSNGGNDDFVSP